MTRRKWDSIHEGGYLSRFTPYWHRYRRRYPFEWRWFADRWIQKGYLPKWFHEEWKQWDEVERGWLDEDPNGK